MSTSNKDNECKTNVNIASRKFTDVVSIRCDPRSKKALNEFCRANGLSLCYVWDTLVWGYLTGLAQKISDVYKSPTINVEVVREVKRVRRYVRDDSGGGHDVFIEDLGSFDKCDFCDSSPVAVHFDRADRYRCQRQFVCLVHHRLLKKKGVPYSPVP